jgi:hypothetical protein
MKTPVKGATHHATKTVQRLKDGGPVTSKPKVEKAERMPSGAQLYVRGETNGDKIRTLNGMGDNGDTMDMPLSKAVSKSVDDLMTKVPKFKSEDRR